MLLNIGNKKNIYGKNKFCFGFTLVEMLIYIALMTLITLVMVQSFILVLKANRTSITEVNIRNSGYSAMEGMLREIYASDGIYTTSAGVLQMTQSGGTNNVKFATSSSNILNFYEGASNPPTLVGPLTSKDIVVKSLIFTPIYTGKSSAVRIQMQLSTTVNGITKTEWFYSTAILRGSY